MELTIHARVAIYHIELYEVESKDASGNTTSFTVIKDTTINGILYHETQASNNPTTVRSFIGLDKSGNVGN